jgi:hypothetical protein
MHTRSLPSPYEAIRGLRRDRVAIRVVERLTAHASDAVAAGTTVLVTVTAPIRLASKTTTAVEAKLRTLLQSGLPRRDTRLTVHGNRIRIRIVRSRSRRAPKLIGLVHNADVNSSKLIDIAERSLDSRRRG